MRFFLSYKRRRLVLRLIIFAATDEPQIRVHGLLTVGEIISGIGGEGADLRLGHIIPAIEMINRQSVLDSPSIDEDLQVAEVNVVVDALSETCDDVREIVFLFHRKMNLSRYCPLLAPYLPLS